MRDYVRIAGGMVVELFSTEEDIATLFHPSFIWVDVTDMKPKIQSGWSAEEVDGDLVFLEPTAPTPTESDVFSTRDSLLVYATLRIAPLQDAVDLEDASVEETELLKKWKQYRVALNRIQDQSGFPSVVKWPVDPTV